MGRKSDARVALGLAQGAIWVGTGVWPFIDRRSFERVTGPKHDWWLVKTVGGLVALIGGGVALAAASRRVTPELRLVAAGSAAFLAAIDVHYVMKRRIPRIYLADAVLESAIAAAWLSAEDDGEVPARRGGPRSRRGRSRGAPT